MVKIIFTFCLLLVALVLGMFIQTLEWRGAKLVSETTKTVKRQLEYAGAVSKDFKFDEKIITRPQNTNIDNRSSEKLYTLLGVRDTDKAYLLNEKNEVIHTWYTPYRKALPNFIQNGIPTNIEIGEAVVFPNGDLIGTYSGKNVTPYGYGLIKMDKNSKVLWTFADTAHHDIFIHPDDQTIYTLTHQFINRFGRDLLADWVVQLSPEGQPLKRISILEAFDNSDFRGLLSNAQPQGAHWDPFHTNSVDVLDSVRAAAFPQFSEGYILISIRNMDTLAVINPETEKVVWAYSGTWSGQHAAHFTPQGTILLFDNNGGGTNQDKQSRILEINPVNNAINVRFRGTPKTPFYSCAYGRIQPLSNGNIVVTETLGSRLFEINPEGEIVWQYKLKPIFQPRVPDIAPFGKNEKNHDADFLCAKPNLATAIVYSQRYTPEELPFLTDK